MTGGPLQFYCLCSNGGRQKWWGQYPLRAMLYFFYAYISLSLLCEGCKRVQGVFLEAFYNCRRYLLRERPIRFLDRSPGVR